VARITKSELIRLQKKLKTDAAIGATHGITRQAVHQLRNRYGIESVVVKNPERNRKMIAMYKGGKSGMAVAAKFGLSQSQTYRILRKKAKAKK
jgi:DNA-directed RNA polymerase specialized sigma subunit